jgi:hypothetical protein
LSSASTLPPLPLQLPSARVAATIEQALAPHLGLYMAQSSVALQREKLGLDGELMTGAQVAELLSHISLGLKVFIGKGTTARLVADIWQVLSAGE